MRNILEYPITHGEACSAIQEAQELFYQKYKDNCGSVDGLALLYAEQFIRKNRDAFEEFTKELPETK